MNLSFKIFLLSFCFLICGSVQSQDDRFLGLVDNVLVEVNPFEPSIETIVELNLPEEVEGTDMTYAEDLCLFYTVIDATDNPKLLSFDFEGNFEVIGPFTIDDATVHVAEGIAYDEDTKIMYISGSIDEWDYFSESLMTVDLTNAKCSLVSSLNFSNGRRADIDNMVIHESILYFNDGQPGDNDTDHYKLDLTNFSLNASVSNYLRVPYDASSDVVFFKGDLYYPTLDRELLTHNANATNPIESNLGETHTAFEYNGIRMRGFEYITGWKDLDVSAFLYNNPACLQESQIIGLNLGEYEVVWNTGETTPSIEITEPGLYSATIYFDDCYLFETEQLLVYPSYEINLDVQSCETDPIDVNGVVYTQSGNYEQNYFTTNGCDSTYLINVAFEDQISFAEEYFLCPGMELEVFDTIITGLGSFEFNFTGPECDTTVTVNVFESFETFGEIEYELCPEESVEINGVLYNAEGDFEQFFSNQENCDSTLYIKIRMLENKEAEMELAACVGFDLKVNDEIYSENGVYVQELQAQNGCDSLLHINIITSDIYIPNVFTPETLPNDKFFPFVICDINFYTCYIFDRWGNRVFFTEDLIGQWNGRLPDGSFGEIGVYTYLMKFGVDEPDEILRKGDVLLLR